MNNNDTCNQCNYWQLNSVERRVCKRYPEQIYKNPDDWCGEFKQQVSLGKIDCDTIEIKELPTVEIINPEASKKRGRPKANK